MHKLLILFLSLCTSTVSFATLTPEQTLVFDSYRDTLNIWSDTLINSSFEQNRTIASYRMIKTLKTALQKPGSFEYTFDSLPSISVQRAEDGSFRIFTWQCKLGNEDYRYYGVIQTGGKNPKLFPLVDYSEFYQNPDSVIVDADRWVGCLYYNIIKVKSGKKVYYTLFGWDDNNSMSSKKYIDILWFDKTGTPQFGYPLFKQEKGKSPTRIILEYKNEASLSLNYFADEKKIFFDHTVPLSGIEEGFYFNYVPDGTMDGYEWKNGLWEFINNIPYEKLEDGEAPISPHQPTPKLYQPK